MNGILSDVCLLIEDCHHSTAPTVDSGHPLIRTPDIGKGRVNYEHVYYVTDRVYDERTTRAKPQINDLILAREAPAGNVAILNSDKGVCLGQRTVLIRPNPELVNPQYLCYYMLLPEQQHKLLGSANGSTVSHVNLPVIRGMKIDLPPLPIQRRIADILSAYDDLIENNQRQIKLLEEAAMRLYREWFVFMRFPGHESVRIEDGVPEGWKYQELKEIADIVMGQSPDSSYYNSDGDGLPFHQGVSNYGERYVSNVEYCSVEKRCAVPNSILFSVRAPVGRINLTREKVVIGRGLAAINHKLGKQSYLFYLLKSHFSVEDMIGNGSVFSAVTKSDLEDQKLLIPSFDLVEVFSRIVEPMDAKINSLDMQIERLQKARDALLPRLMNGGEGLKLEGGAV